MRASTLDEIVAGGRRCICLIGGDPLLHSFVVGEIARGLSPPLPVHRVDLDALCGSCKTLSLGGALRKSLDHRFLPSGILFCQDIWGLADAETAILLHFLTAEILKSRSDIRIIHSVPESVGAEKYQALFESLFFVPVTTAESLARAVPSFGISGGFDLFHAIDRFAGFPLELAELTARTIQSAPAATTEEFDEVWKSVLEANLLLSQRATIPSSPVPSELDGVFLEAEVKRQILGIASAALVDASRYRQFRVEPPRGLLLHGPPGTGKTTIAAAIARLVGDAKFFSVTVQQVLHSQVGASEKSVERIVAAALERQPCVLFFDEIDSLFGTPRADTASSAVLRRARRVFLSLVDALPRESRVLLLAATNRVDCLDESLLRAGRFDRALYIGIPSIETRLSQLLYLVSCSPPTVERVLQAKQEILERIEPLTPAEVCSFAQQLLLSAGCGEAQPRTKGA